MAQSTIPDGYLPLFAGTELLRQQPGLTTYDPAILLGNVPPPPPPAPPPEP